MKPGRQSIIMEIINEKDIETQNQLLEELAARGVKSTHSLNIFRSLVSSAATLGFDAAA